MGFTSKLSQAIFAVLISGELRSLKAKVSKIQHNLVDAIGHDSVDIFLNVATVDTWGEQEGVDHGTSAVLDVVKRLEPRAWSINNMSLPGSFDICNRGETDVCAAQDVGNGLAYSAGCYRGNGLACRWCDTRKYWKQFGRLMLTYRLALQYERMRAQHYHWFIRLRTDILNSGLSRMPFPPAEQWRNYDDSTLYMKGRAGLNDVDRAKCVFEPFGDTFWITPRNISDRVFALALTFMQCQERGLNSQWCCGPGLWNWATAECVLTVHMRVCLQAFKIAEFPPWIHIGGKGRRR